MNGVIDGTDIIYRDYCDISIAVATPKGLVVPVLRDADKLDFAGVERVHISSSLSSHAAAAWPFQLQCCNDQHGIAIAQPHTIAAKPQTQSGIWSQSAHEIAAFPNVQAIAALGKKARHGTISIDDMAGGTFTISNGGVYGR